VDEQTEHLGAGGRIAADDVAARSVVVTGHAGGTIDVRALDEVEGLVESGTRARIHGAPARRDVQTRSGGTVTYVGE
jgi:hypothetical protein